jgi:mannosylglycerate hydrolase
MNRDEPSPAPDPGLDIILVSHTHWDREWYRTFQGFRLRLVDVLDTLIDALAARPDAAPFLLDGQTIMLEDYLALRPERATVLRSLLESGRLSAGPWYIQPDEFLASGEALIRNLLLGCRLAGELGGATRDGWLPDTFGHAAQLPQILRNFDIETFVFTRGLGDHLPESRLEFWWEAPNGDRVLALHQAGGYWNAGNLGYRFFWGETEGIAPSAELALAQVRELADRLAPQAATRTIAVWNGADHLPFQASLPDLIPTLNERLDGCQVRLGSIQSYARAVLEAGPSLPVVRGELRGSRYQALLYSTLSSRIYLKQANHRVERRLERQAEPLAALAWLAGQPYPAAQLREAWRLIVQNHAHDSICGCSIDEVHREMMSRFEQAEQIGTEIGERSLLSLAPGGGASRRARSAVPVLVFNPLGRERREVVEVALRLPSAQPAYEVIGPDGSMAPVQALSVRTEDYPWLDRQITAAELLSQVWWWRECLLILDGLDVADFEWQPAGAGAALHLRLADRAAGGTEALARLVADAERLPAGVPLRMTASYTQVRMAFVAHAPACGYAVYDVVGRTAAPAAPDAVRCGANWLESEFLRVEVERQGLLRLTDKATGRRLRGLHRFEDLGDAGDLYDYGPVAAPDPGAVVDECWCGPGPVQGGLVAELSLRLTLRAPKALATGRRSRSTRQVALPIASVLRLRAGCPWLEIETTVDNRARDHRLRVLFPTGAAADAVLSDGQFAITTRSAVPPARGDWCQPPSGIAPHHTWFGAGDGGDGLAILSEGLPEHEARPGADGLELALTLLRAVGELSRGDLATRPGQAGPSRPVADAQCLGEHHFRYGILPYAGNAVTAGVPGLAAAFDDPLLARPVAPGRGRLPARLSLVEPDGVGLEVTALKVAEAGDQLVVRFYNAGDQPVASRVRFGLAMARVCRATAEERETGELAPLPGGEYAIDVGPCEIMTLLAEPAGAPGEGGSGELDLA